MTDERLNVTAADVPALLTRTACPACATPAGAPIYQVAYDGPNLREYLVTFYGERAEALFPHLAGGAFALVLCPSCGLVFHRDVPNEALQRLLYDEVIDIDEVEAGHANDRVDYFARYAQEIMLLLARLGRPTSHVRVLDYGMGMARWTRMAKAFGCDVYGYDPSPERQRRAAARGVQTLTRDEIAGARFDVIHTEQVLEHRIDPADDTQLLAGSLNPGGLHDDQRPERRRRREVAGRAGLVRRPRPGHHARAGGAAGARQRVHGRSPSTAWPSAPASR